jgi:hypothetical protein
LPIFEVFESQRTIESHLESRVDCAGEDMTSSQRGPAFRVTYRCALRNRMEIGSPRTPKKIKRWNIDRWALSYDLSENARQAGRLHHNAVSEWVLERGRPTDAQHLETGQRGRQPPVAAWWPAPGKSELASTGHHACLKWR